LHLTETQAPQIAVLKLGPLMLSQADHSYLHSPTLILPGATAGKLPPTLPKQPLQTRTLLIIQHVKILHTKAGKRLHMQDQYLGTHFSRCSQELSTILLIQMQLFKGTE
jgi:hypothetical protein